MVLFVFCFGFGAAGPVFCSDPCARQSSTCDHFIRRSLRHCRELVFFHLFGADQSRQRGKLGLFYFSLSCRGFWPDCFQGKALCLAMGCSGACGICRVGFDLWLGGRALVGLGFIAELWNLFGFEKAPGFIACDQRHA